MDEMFASIGGKRIYPWPAIDQGGEVLDVPVQAKCDTKAALRLMRRYHSPRTAITTDYMGPNEDNGPWIARKKGVILAIPRPTGKGIRAWLP